MLGLPPHYSKGGRWQTRRALPLHVLGSATTAAAVQGGRAARGFHMAPPPGGDEGDWFEDYDTDMSDASGEGGSDQGSPFPSDSEGAGGGAAAGASSDDDGGSDGGDDGFEGRVASETRADHKNRLYTVIDRQSLLRMQVCAPQGGRGATCMPVAFPAGAAR